MPNNKKNQQRNTQIVHQTSWIQMATFIFPFAALAIPWVSCCEIAAVDTDVIGHVQETHNAQTHKPSASPVLESDLRIFKLLPWAENNSLCT